MRYNLENEDGKQDKGENTEREREYNKCKARKQQW